MWYSKSIHSAHLQAEINCTLRLLNAKAIYFTKFTERLPADVVSSVCFRSSYSPAEEDDPSCTVLVWRADMTEKLSINKICTTNASCGLQVNETQALCVDGMTTSNSRSACTTCCGQDACNVNAAPPRTCPVPPFPATLASPLFASYAVAVLVTRFVMHSLDDVLTSVE